MRVLPDPTRLQPDLRAGRVLGNPTLGRVGLSTSLPDPTRPVARSSGNRDDQREKNRNRRNKSRNHSFKRQQYNTVCYKCDEEKHK